MRRPLVRDDLRSMDGYHSPQVKVDVRLNTNEAPVAPPAEFQAAFLEEVANVDWHRYPDRLAQSLREDLAALHQVEADQIFVANGSNEVLQTLCLTFGGHGRTAVTFEPTYAMYGQIARTTQCRVVEVDRDEGFRIPMSGLEDVITSEKPDLMFLCSPNNPTGTAESEEIVEAAVSLSPGVVVVDEAYGQFADFSAIEKLNQSSAPESLVVTRTFSKTWSMAGVRLGYCVAPQWMLPEFEKVVLPYHLDSVKQIAGRIALRFHDQMEQRVGQISEERQRVSDALARLGFDVFPSQANFIMFRSSPCGLEGNELWQRLLAKSILVRDCSGWPRLSDCLRVTLGTESENNMFLEAVKEAIE
ncbi:MAG: histidinol-phosphate transaminase [Actinomycetota bacterium]|nr:histidinol-phosphate transaminase [Actinomycetota bacterium]MEC9058655.1 histidinol-phosphate transaminase [Actinomycetota bacterium]